MRQGKDIVNINITNEYLCQALIIRSTLPSMRYVAHSIIMACWLIGWLFGVKAYRAKCVLKVKIPM